MKRKTKSGAGSEWFSYSIRLTDAERQLVSNAASARSWTPTALIKQATIEKAAAIANLAQPTRFAFESIARGLAKQLCQTEAIFVEPDDRREYLNLKGDPENGLYTLDPPQMDLERLEVLKTAVRLGGTEFLGRVLDECKQLLLADGQPFLPEPIDPAKLG